MGDLNDSTEPIFVLRREGFVDCFEALGRSPRPTVPARPTANGPDQTIDWLFARGPVLAKTAEVIDFWHDDLAPSDHKPILATYELHDLDHRGETVVDVIDRLLTRQLEELVTLLLHPDVSC